MENTQKKIFAILNIAFACLMCLAIYSAFIGIPYTQAASNRTILKAYDNFLSSSNMLWSGNTTKDSGIRFRVEDLNADGKSELLMYDEKSNNAIGQLAIYTYEKKMVKFVSSYTLYDVTFYRNNSGLICSEIYKDGYYMECQVWNKNKAITKYICYGDMNIKSDSISITDKTWYTSNGKKISAKDAKKKIAKLKKGGSKLRISEGAENMYINNKHNRKKYVK